MLQQWTLISRLELERREMETCARGILAAAMGMPCLEISSRVILTCSHEVFCSSHTCPEQCLSKVLSRH